MRKNYLLLLLTAFFAFNMSAQIDPFFDNLEGETDGADVCSTPGPNEWWIDWFSDCSTAGQASSAQAYSGSLSFYVRPSDPGAGDVIDPVLDLGNKIFGTWYLSFWYYVPSNREAYFNIQGVTPIAGGEWVVGNIPFNGDLLTPGEGQIDNSALGAVTFTFPHDQWFRIYMGWDISGGISTATWFMYVDGNEVIPPGTAFTDSGGTVPTSLGGLNFFSVGPNNEYYIDDVEFCDFCTGGISDLETIGVSMHPNPVKDRLNVQAREAISNVTVYNLLGQQVYTANIDALTTTIDMSQMTTGTYFVQVEVNGRTAVDKIIK
ncbi:T9SS type A sorting domain-containing protein [Aureisphaera galaxeae]|uniref:T9SS type A sorting domain-containing protein n=1 Tax=Aureisphaera galaxeae TaxID=1538023 RepID=UPI0023507D82|nr:T9SS type A sorting domain-containing protein [Aureisphaera galaxeae]MDC8004419.1 T9SS type A sorting domain-containing protein [Aureisphaera galaxeae]